jgi:hypothetical protein
MVNCDDVPNNPIETNIGMTTATLTWDAVVGVQAYNLRYRKLSEPFSSNIYIVTTATSLQLNSLISGADYTWDLRAICDTVNSIQSNWTGFTIFHTAEPCADPTNLGVRNNFTTLTGASLKWFGPNNPDYLVMFKESTATNWDTVNVNGTVVTNITLLPFGVNLTSQQVGQEK